MSEHEMKTKQGIGQRSGRSEVAPSVVGVPGKRTLAGDVAGVDERVPTSDVQAPQERSNAEGMQSVVVRPTLAAFTPPPVSTRRPAAPSGGAEAHASAEGLAPQQTETEKRNYMAAGTPVSRDLTPAGSSGLTNIRLSDVVIQGEVFDDGGAWKIRVTSASTHIHWGINSGGYQIPNPVDGGNITQANWEDVIRELAGYQARQASGAWHDPHASEVHELDHVHWYQGEIARTWATIERTITAKVLGATASMTRMDAETAMAAYLTSEKRAWFDAYGLAPEPPAYAAGQAVLDGIIARIRTYAASKSWAAGGGGHPPP